ncbi:MGMT family protein [Pseudodesulfovibrio indicus]|jgi:methylated-DNA-protein-cysteine methyltransferase-like protein|uniref:DNA methyltransferase n=1 Tax=Pseudodesulfovibrio indicus TaxID=1716143 RepID=A0A126QPS3_9BACT|nr:MGMT family protein [Pseudodesulfovibrio indicus]AMK11708.1 DNA methyltransferase [Pseudodesulfovibrio indicus]TDT88239.1 O(6)-alkylguanine repair protein YbaZ [Pseudodesulfovibrio indicus]
MQSAFTRKTIDAILSIPWGKVSTYGDVAAMAGNRRGARQVARVLHSCSRTEGLPWHRVVNREGRISLDPMQGGDLQKRLLIDEGVEFNRSGRIDLALYGWFRAPAIP